jgi:uncharacterized protein (TIGR02246 family)
MSTFFTRLLFEDLSVLLPVELVALAIVIGLYRHWRTPRSRLAVWIALSICAGLVALQHLVTTDREAIRAMVERMAAAVQEGDVPALGEHFAEDLVFEGDRGKNQVMQHATAVLQQNAIHNARVSAFIIEVRGDDATATFQAVADIRTGGSEPNYNAPTRWELKCRREPAGWRVCRAKYEIGLAGFRF